MLQHDITNAVLDALARVHPRTMTTDVLARAVNCDEEALKRLLRLLSAVGAVLCVAALTRPEMQVGITDTALELLRTRN